MDKANAAYRKCQQEIRDKLRPGGGGPGGGGRPGGAGRPTGSFPGLPPINDPFWDVKPPQVPNWDDERRRFIAEHRRLSELFDRISSRPGMQSGPPQPAMAGGDWASGLALGWAWVEKLRQAAWLQKLRQARSEERRVGKESGSR